MALSKFLLFLQIFVIFEKRYSVESAVVPPPWADPKVNPCAVQPRGWQLLFWPPDGKCYKIFKMGYPCPDDMELSPATTTSGVRDFSAECRCPPKTAQSTYDGHCYELFKTGPCRNGQYFGPDKRNHTESELKKRHWGICKDIPKCENSNEIFWPQNGRCYEKLTKGPCTKGHLITSTANGLAVCACNHKTDMIDYYYAEYGCFQHFTKGPCKEKGHLFLPDKSCNCNDELPHFHDSTRQCFEIGDQAKDAWERLRRCYTNALHRRRHKKNSKRIFPWKFEREMSFLLPFLEVRKSKYDQLYYSFDDNQDTLYDEELHVKDDIDNGDDDVQDNLVENLSTHFMDQMDADKRCSIGPCLYGEEFQLDSTKKKGTCSCKKGYIRYEVNKRCYRTYTQGPCPAGQMLVNRTSCDIQPCKRGELYFPKEKSCYRVGTKGPCPSGQVVTFDFETRPSLDGISYNGLCRCANSKPCQEKDENEKNSCIRHDQVLFQNKCFKLYTQGPCKKGAWLTPVRHRKEDIWTEEVDRRTGTCDCMPGFTRTLKTVQEKVVVECLSPSVILAEYLNKNYVSHNDTELFR